jgi:hypothetical protein
MGLARRTILARRHSEPLKATLDNRIVVQDRAARLPPAGGRNEASPARLFFITEPDPDDQR